ncbi:MAG: TRAM domain-containing protein [Leptospiraceae bacterium]|nr:TRAM domain-containing protein [Leptospiraceae bacterium]
MNILYRVLASLASGSCGFFLSYASGGDMATSITGGALVLAVSLAFFFIDRVFKGISGETFFCITTGVLAGLLLSALLGWILETVGASRELLSAVGPYIYVLPAAILGYGGYLFSVRPGLRIFGGGGFRKDEQGGASTEKILDTSVIIDGRILDIAQTNFIEGPFIIPNFVLREIQLISDSPDPIKRNRGRRGLEMLNKLQQLGTVRVKISYIDYTDTREVDAKLVKLSLETGGKLITNDFNLNKVAELQGVEVLNLNNLTNALKPIVLPGEDIVIDVIKEGKDENQGIGYLEDGTMVVVENGRNLLGKTVQVNVTSIIQTAAGKMIFTRANGSGEPTQGGDDRGKGHGGDRNDRGDRDRGDRNERNDRGGRRGNRDREAAGGGGRRRGR